MTPTHATVAADSAVFPTLDGAKLAGTLFRPSDPTGSAVLVAGALGIPQRFYTAFSTCLAAQRHLVMTFDLRGIGASRNATRLNASTPVCGPGRATLVRYHRTR